MPISSNQMVVAQDDITNAIGASTELDAIVAKLTSIDTKTIVATNTSKNVIVGLTTTNAITVNLLDPIGLGAWTDVRDYSTLELTFLAGAQVLNLTTLQSAFNATGLGFSAASPSVQGYDVSGLASTLVSVPANTVVRVRYDISSVAFVRIGNTTPIAGNRVIAVLGTASTVFRVNAVPSNNTINANVVNALTGVFNTPVPGSFTDIANSITTTSATTVGVPVPNGQSYQSFINVTAISGTSTQLIARIQESSDNGINWRTVYTFEPITIANGIRQYRSPLLVYTGNRIRISETVTGTTPSITRSVSRLSIATTGVLNHNGRSITTYNANLGGIDIPAYGVIQGLTVSQSDASLIFVQLHDSFNPVALGALSLQSFRVPNVGLILGASYFGNGKQFNSAINPRLVISSTAHVYTPIALPIDTIQLCVDAI